MSYRPSYKKLEDAETGQTSINDLPLDAETLQGYKPCVNIVTLEDNNSTTAGTWLAKTNKVSSLVDGQLFLYKITVDGASTTTLNITGSGGALGAKTVYRVGTTKLTTQYAVGHYILLAYNSLNTCFRVVNDYDANSDTYVRQYQHGKNAAGTTNLYPILTRYNLTNKSGTYDNAYARFHTDTYIDVTNGYLYAPKVYSGGSEVVTKVNDTSPNTNGNVSLNFLKSGDYKASIPYLTSNATIALTSDIPVTKYTQSTVNLYTLADGRYINSTENDITMYYHPLHICNKKWKPGDILYIKLHRFYLLTQGSDSLCIVFGAANDIEDFAWCNSAMELDTIPQVHESMKEFGNESTPVYLSRDTNYGPFRFKKCKLYGGGTGIEDWNGYDALGKTVNAIYAPETAGTSGQFLKSNGSGAPVWADLATVATSGSYNDLTGVPIPGDSGEIKTKYRCAFKGYTGSGSPIWYYKLVKLPADNAGNYASVIVNGRIGGWTASGMSSIYCLIWNRDGVGLALLDLGGTGIMSSIFDAADLVVYKNSDKTADIYIRCKDYFAFDLDVEVYQSTASITYDGTYTTTTPSGTESGKASTSTSRLQLEKGVLKVNGEDVITSSKSAVDSGTDLSLVTTGEKYIWNNKQGKISVGTNGQLLSSNGSSLVWTNDNRGLLHHDLVKVIENTTTDKGWKMFMDDPDNDPPINGFFLRSLRFNAQSPSWGVGDYGAGIVFGGSDTKGVMSVSYGNPQIKIAGGNGEKPVWWIGLTGTSATTYDLDDLNDKQDKISSVGSTTKPVYFSSDGVASACLNYGGGTKVTLNGTECKGTSASFYAPKSAGTSGYSLKSNGSGAPRWANTAKVQISGSLSAGVHNNTSITLVITSASYPLNKGVWRYSGTYGTFLIFAPTAITTQGSPRTAYICGYTNSIYNNSSFELVEV